MCNRMNCNLFRALRYKYVKDVIGYCKAFGWKYMWYDTFGIGNRC